MRKPWTGLPPHPVDGNRRRWLGRYGLLLLLLYHVPLLALLLQKRGRMHGLELYNLAAMPQAVAVVRGGAPKDLLLAWRRRLHGRAGRPATAAALRQEKGRTAMKGRRPAVRSRTRQQDGWDGMGRKGQGYVTKDSFRFFFCRLTGLVR